MNDIITNNVTVEWKKELEMLGREGREKSMEGEEGGSRGGSEGKYRDVT